MQPFFPALRAALSTSASEIKTRDKKMRTGKVKGAKNVKGSTEHTDYGSFSFIYIFFFVFHIILEDKENGEELVAP